MNQGITVLRPELWIAFLPAVSTPTIASFSTRRWAAAQQPIPVRRVLHSHTELTSNWTELKWQWIEPSSLRSDIARPRTLSADQRKGATAAAPWTAKTARAPPPARIHPRWAYARTLVAYPWARTFQIGMPERGKVFCFFFSFLFCCVRLRPCLSVASDSVTHRARTARLLLLSACACVSEIMLQTDAYFVSFGVCVGGFRN